LLKLTGIALSVLLLSVIGISNYVGEQAATSQSSTIAKSSVGTLQINSGYFTASKYSPAELIVSGEINNYLQGVPLTIQITKPDKTTEEQNILVTKNGAFRAPIKIEGSWPAGSYQLLAKYGTQDLGAVSFSVNMGSAPPPTPTPQAKNYLSYENNQYGFSIKYPSDLKKEETLTESDTFLNSISIVSFTTPSELSTIGVSLIKDDTTFKGLSGQKFLDKMKNEFESGVCSAVDDPTLTCSMEAPFEESGTNQNGYVVYTAVYVFTISDNQDSHKLTTFITMFPDGNDVWVLGLAAFAGENYQGIGEEAGNMFDTFTIYDYKGEQKQLLLQSKAAQKNDIVYIVIKNPKDSTDDIYSIKLTNINGKITNFIKIKDWNYVRLGSDSVMYQTISSPLASSDVFKVALKVDSKNTEIQWEAFSKDQKSLGTGKVRT